jgi:hypothetical protein
MLGDSDKGVKSTSEYIHTCIHTFFGSVLCLNFTKKVKSDGRKNSQPPPHGNICFNPLGSRGLSIERGHKLTTHTVPYHLHIVRSHVP